MYFLAPRIWSQQISSFNNFKYAKLTIVFKFTEQLPSLKMSGNCPGQLLHVSICEFNLPFHSPRRYGQHCLGILPINPSCNSLHSSIRSHHVLTHLAGNILQKGVLLGDNWLWTYSNSQLHLPDH